MTTKGEEGLCSLEEQEEGWYKHVKNKPGKFSPRKAAWDRQLLMGEFAWGKDSPALAPPEIGGPLVAFLGKWWR